MREICRSNGEQRQVILAQDQVSWTDTPVVSCQKMPPCSVGQRFNWLYAAYQKRRVRPATAT